jgi:hypothetical protein
MEKRQTNKVCILSKNENLENSSYTQVLKAEKSSFYRKFLLKIQML